MTGLACSWAAIRHRLAMRNCLLHALLLMLLSGVSGLAADELRLNYYMGQEELDFSPRGTDGFDAEWDNNARYEISAFSNLGTIWGFGIITQRADVAVEDENWKLEYESWALRLYSGKAPLANESFTWEINGFTGFGMAKGDLSRTGGFDGGSDREFLLEYGAETAVTLNLGRTFLVGAGVTYSWSQVKLDLDGDRNVDQQGLAYFAYAGWRF